MAILGNQVADVNLARGDLTICFWLKCHDEGVEAAGLKKLLFRIIQEGVCAVAGLDLFSSVDGHLDDSLGDHGRYGRHHSCYGGAEPDYVEVLDA